MNVGKLFLIGNELFRDGIKRLFAGSAFEIVDEANSLVEADRLLAALPVAARCPDILLVALNGNYRGDEIALLHRLSQKRPELKVVILGDVLSLGRLWEEFKEKIDGYLPNDVSVTCLMHALPLVIGGLQIFPTSYPIAPLNPLPPKETATSQKALTGLSAREGQILRLIAVGYSNKAIARDLNISHETVKVHLRALLRKVNARNRTQAALWGVEHGFVEASRILALLLPAIEIFSNFLEDGTSSAFCSLANAMA
jgi:two-component system, NarL family, nitrate/nitrite response regulator NarL